jgi:hypothetical protein
MRHIREAGVLGLVALLLAAVAAQAELCPMLSRSYQITGYQALTVSNSAVGLTVPAGSGMAVAVLETAAVRLRQDGTNPTSTVGTPLTSGTQVVLCGGELSASKFIRSTGTDGVLHVHYYGP